MNWLSTPWLSTPLVTALAQTLLHSLWEGACVALALAVFVCFARTARARYAAACVAMVILLAGLVVTFTRLAPAAAIRAEYATVKTVPQSAGQAGGSIVQIPARERQQTDYATWAVSLWLAGVFVFYLRGIASWMAARRLRRTGVCHATELWQMRMDRLRARLQLSRAVVLMESSLAEVPVVIGYLRPMILMPVGLMAGMPVAQVESILLHELAHIRRYDYVVNLLQIFVEGLLFYHPAVWWISNVMRTEREHCCDDLVVGALGGALEYATALTALEQRRVEVIALAATGGSLVNRVGRLLGRPQNRYARVIPLLTAALFTVTAFTAMVALQGERAVAQVPAGPIAPVAQATSVGQATPAAPAPSTDNISVPVPVTNQAIAASPTVAVPDRKIAANDLISVSVFNEPSVSKASVRVGADGSISMPSLTKRLQVGGLLPREAEAVIARGFTDEMILVHPVVTVSMLEYAVRRISVVGNVKLPGQFEFTMPITLVEALAKAGGTTPEAGPELLLTQYSEAPRRISILQLQSGSDEALNVLLKGGEVISVPDAPKVWVTGHVIHPGPVPLQDPAEATVLKIIAKSEGLTANYGKTAFIYRIDGTGRRQEIEIPLRDIMHRTAPDVKLQADDILLVPDESGIARRQTLRDLQAGKHPDSSPKETDK